MANRSLRELFEPANLLFVLAAVVATSLIWSTAKAIETNYHLQQEVDDLNNQISILELENDNLRFNIEYYKTSNYLELAAREKFNKKAAGEKVVFLSKDEEDSTQADQTEAPQQVEDKPLYRQNLDQWLYFLFDKEPS
jgi:cell division protein FtsB